MLAGELVECQESIFLQAAKNSSKTYGGYFEKFALKVSQTFEKIIRISFSMIPENEQFAIAIFGTILIIKNFKYLDGDESCLTFLNDIEKLNKWITEANSKIKLDRILELMSSKIQSQVKFKEVVPLDQVLNSDIHEMVNLIAGNVAAKNSLEIYTQEQINKISSFFGQNICLINYDKNKECLREVPITHKNTYLLKIKNMYFILIKQQEIELIDQGTINHEELASIFKIQDKLEDPESPKKSSIIIKNSNSRIIAEDELKRSNITNKSIIKSTSTISQKQDYPDLSSSRLKQSVLFPSEVPCATCCKKISEFSTIFWNYSHYCFECILNPRIDISFIPSSLVQKFLKSQKLDFRQYVVICPQCKSQTFIGNYRPWDKPKGYRCKVCHKDICIQHEKMVNQCFCECSKCRERTISIPTIFVKYCLNCRGRFCEICNTKSRVDCSCICQICGINKLVDHEECKPKCHSCDAREIPVNKCKCGRYLCSSCFFNSCQPNSKICSLDSK